MCGLLWKFLCKRNVDLSFVTVVLWQPTWFLQRAHRSDRRKILSDFPHPYFFFLSSLMIGLLALSQNWAELQTEAAAVLVALCVCMCGCVCVWIIKPQPVLWPAAQSRADNFKFYLHISTWFWPTQLFILTSPNLSQLLGCHWAQPIIPAHYGSVGPMVLLVVSYSMHYSVLTFILLIKDVSFAMPLLIFPKDLHLQTLEACCPWQDVGSTLLGVYMGTSILHQSKSIFGD